MEIYKNDKINLKYSFIKIAIHGETISYMFFQRLSEIRPEWKILVNNSDKKHLQNQFIFVLKELILNSFNENEVLRILQTHFPQLDKDNMAEMLPSVGSALLWSFKQILAQQFTDELNDSWKMFIDFSTQICIRKAYQRERAIAI